MTIESDSWTINKFLILGGVKVAFSCFKQLPINFKQTFEFSYHLIHPERLLLVVVGVEGFSAETSLYFHDTTFSVSHFKYSFKNSSNIKRSCVSSLMTKLRLIKRLESYVLESISTCFVLFDVIFYLKFLVYHQNLSFQRNFLC